MATGFEYSSARRAEQAEILLRVLPAVRDIRRMGSAALDLCALACGRVDGYYERGLSPWDLAAGALIAAEAGATVGGLRGAQAGPSWCWPPPRGYSRPYTPSYWKQTIDFATG